MFYESISHQTFYIHETQTVANLFLKEWANPGPFFVYFWSFQTNNTIFYNKSMWKMSCPSSIRRRDSNPRPLDASLLP